MFAALIRYWVEVVRLLPCAVTVFLAYRKMGYYPWFKTTSAIGQYYKEKARLSAEVLVEYAWGFVPIGTLMCSLDSGWLPVDEIFPQHMQVIRRAGIRLGYFGKFAVIPRLRGGRTGKRLIKRAKQWGLANNLDRVVIIVNPCHVRYFRRRGFTLLARDDRPNLGLEKAPAVLLCLRKENFIG